MQTEAQRRRGDLAEPPEPPLAPAGLPYISPCPPSRLPTHLLPGQHAAGDVHRARHDRLHQHLVHTLLVHQAESAQQRVAGAARQRAAQNSTRHLQGKSNQVSARTVRVVG